jgi:hypothetical protein
MGFMVISGVHPEIQIVGMKCKARSAQQPERTRVREDCEHRTTTQFARKMNL